MSGSAPAVRTEPPEPPKYDARALTRGGDRAEVLLDGKLYTLRVTRAGKLILTK